jgi:D-aspartate ligase
MDTSVPVVVLNLFTHCGVTAVRSLGRLGVDVSCVHGDPRAPSLRSRYAQHRMIWDIETETDEDSVQQLVDLAGAFADKPLLIPTEDHSCLFVDANSDELGEAYRFPSRPPGLARSLSNKESMYRLCREHRIPTPAVFVPESIDDARTFAVGADFPVMVKALDTRHFSAIPGAGKVVAKTADELIQAYSRLTDDSTRSVLFQEYIPGDASTVWMFNGYFNASSECLFGITGKKLRQYPPYIGQTSLGLCVRNDRVDETVLSLMKAVGYTGILDIGLRYDARDDQYKVLDVNPRVGSAFRLFVGDNGMDVVRALYLDMTGQDVPPAKARSGRKWVVENYDLAASAKYLRDGALRVPDWVRSFRGVEEAAWFARDDISPWAAMWIDSARYAIAAGRARTDGDRSWWYAAAPSE